MQNAVEVRNTVEESSLAMRGNVALLKASPTVWPGLLYLEQLTMSAAEKSVQEMMLATQSVWYHKWC